MNLPPSFRGLPTSRVFVAEVRRFVAGDSCKLNLFRTPRGWQAELLGLPLAPPFDLPEKDSARGIVRQRMREWLGGFEILWRSPLC